MPIIPPPGGGGGSGDALTTNPLSQFAATTSSQLAGVISDETGSGALVFATSPTLVTPVLGAAAFTTLTGSQAIAATSTDGVVLSTPTAATVGAQKWSPRIRWSGSGWKTTATAAAQVVDWIAELVPVQGSTAPGSALVFSKQVNGGGYVPLLNIATDSWTGLSSTAGSLVFGDVGADTGMLAPGNGGLYLGRSIGAGTGPSAWIGYASGYVVSLPSDGVFSWSANGATGQFAGTGDTRLSRSAAGILALVGSSTGAAFELTEMTAPSAGGANTARLYAQDNGSGKTRLVVLFPSGVQQVLATEP